jgi:hypothetical protein
MKDRCMSTTTPFPMGVFVGGPNGSDASVQAQVSSQFDSFANLLGSTPQFMDGYVDQSQSIWLWPGNASWTAWSWAQMPQTAGITPVIGLPMATTADFGNPDATFRAFASGQYDSVLKGVVQSWAAQGFDTQYWRPGYEMNVSSMPWYVGSDAQTQADYVSAFQHISSVLHSAGQSQGVDVKVVWSANVQNWNGSTDVLGLYPGNSAVDVIGPDLYDNMYPRDLYDWGRNDGTVDSNFSQWASNPANIEHYFSYPTANQYNPTGDGAGNGLSLQSFIDLAKANGKPIALSETGAGGGGSTGTFDDPTFVKWLANTLQNAGVPVSYVIPWDVNDNGPWDFSSASAGKPLEAAAWKQYFGAQSSSSTPTATPTPTPTVATSTNSIVLNLSQDSWYGDAQFTVSLNGTQVGGVQTATASHGSGQSQAITVQGGDGTLSVSFVNDAYGGTSSSDRNLYVDSVVVNGTTVAGKSALYNNGTQSFTISASSAATLESAPSQFLTTATAIAAAGDSVLQASASELLDFSAGTFGNDTITGFDPSSDVVRLAVGQVASYADLQSKLSNSGGSAVLTVDSSHAITFQDVAPSSLAASNFAFA